VQFPVESLTVELQVGVTRSKEGKAGTRVPFVSADAGAAVGMDRSTPQTVTVVLGAPIDPQGRSVKVAQHSDELKR
jgi:hypothetical protein